MKKKYLNRAAVLILLAAAFLPLQSCSKDERKAETSQLSEADGAKAAAVESPEKEQVPVGKDGQSDKGAAPAVVSETGGDDFLLYSTYRSAPVPAQDFEIGALQSGIAVNGISADIYNNAREFLQSLVDGDVAEELVASPKRQFVMRMIDDGLAAEAPVDFRIGAIDTMAKPACAGVRFFSEKGSSSGMIYFVREGVWKVYDLHLDFEGMREGPGQNTGGGSGLWDPADTIEVKNGEYYKQN